MPSLLFLYLKNFILHLIKYASLCSSNGLLIGWLVHALIHTFIHSFIYSFLDSCLQDLRDNVEKSWLKHKGEVCLGCNWNIFEGVEQVMVDIYRKYFHSLFSSTYFIPFLYFSPFMKSIKLQ